MAYRLTPYDRRVQAELIRKEREARYASRYPTYKKTGAAAVAPVQDEKKNDNAFLRVLQTGLDLNVNAVGGLWQSVEGLVDLVATGVGAIGGIFSDDFRDGVKDFVATDYTDKLFMQNMDKLTEGSYLNEGKAGEIIEGVAQGVGQMLPDVLLSVATAGAYAGAAGAKAAATAGTVAAKQAAKAAAKTAAKQAAIKAGQRAAMVSLAAHATGSGIQEAFADGASYGEGVAYGALTGATEVATEKLTGGMGRLYGKGIGAAVKTGAKTVGKEVAEVGIKRAAKEALGEGVEEMISEVANPALKTIYKGKDALKEYSDEEFWGGVLEAGVVGMGTSAAYGGTVGRVMKTTGVYADANSVAEHIEQQKKLRGKSGLSQAERVQIEQNIKSDQELLSGRLQKLSETKRAKVLERMPAFKVMFEADGTIKAEQKAALDAKIKAAGDSTYNAEIRSSTADAERITEALKNGSTENHKMRAYTGPLTEAQRKNVDDVREVMGAVSERSGEAIGDFVIAEKSPDGPAYFDETTGLMVIGMDAVENGTAAEEITRALEKAGWQEAVVHETWHGIENTKTGELLLKHIESNDALHALATQDFLSRDYDTEFFGTNKVEAEKKLRALIAKAKSGETLTDAEQEAYDDYRSEVGGFANQRLFGNKAFMKKLITTEPSTAEKLIGKIREMREDLKVRKDPEAREQLDFVRKAEKLFMQGLSEAGGTIDSNGKIHLANREEDKEKNPAEGEVRWSLRVKRTNGQENIVNPYEISRDAILEYLHLSKRRQLQEKTYFPVRSHTPSILIASLRAEGIEIADKPLAMQARKAYQAQREGYIHTRDGETIRCHAMTAEETLEVIDKLDEPEILIQEKEHYEIQIDKNKQKKEVLIPERFAVFVTLDNEKKCVAILQFEANMSDSDIVEDGKGDSYHTTVTVFAPDGEYDVELSERDYTSEIEIESSTLVPQYGGTPATASKVELPTNSISQKSKKSTPSAQKNSGKVKRLMAGTKARTADKMKLATAQQMIAEGVDSETVRRETGWFQGYDGKWRFEIDDSQMEFSREGYGVNEREKLIQEERELLAKIVYQSVINPNGDHSALEARLQVLRDKYEKTPAVTLPFYVKHDALFEAYPELREVKVVLKPNISMGYGIKENEIRIDRNFSDKEIKNILIHEMQHAVQQIEDFSGGANSAYWANKLGQENPEAYEIALENLWREYRDMRQHSTDSFLAKVKEFLYLTRNTKEQNYSPEQKAMFEDLLMDREGQSFGRYMHYYQKLMEMDERFGENHPYKMYLRTAGEVEANDTQRRIDLTAEQRKDIRPDIDRTNVLFADKESVFFGKDLTDFDNIILPDDVKYSGKNVQYAKRRYKQITEEEYAVISSRIAESNSKFVVRNEPLPKFGVARSANFFYVYENFIPGEFGVLKQIRIDAVEKTYLSAIEAQIRSVNKNGTYTSTSDVNKMLDVLQGQRRRNRSNHADGSDGRSDRGNGRISPKESQGDGIGNTRGSNEDRRDVKRPRKQTGETVIETAENVSESSKSVRRLANPKSVDNLTEEQYNNFGWVRANDILESDEYERAMSDFASLKKGDQYRKTAEGEFVIPTSKYYGASEGTVSAIVFVKGEMDLPNITRIWLLNHSNSQTLKKVRGVICERLLERRNGTRDFVGDLYGEEFIGEYRASDFPTYQEYQNQLRQQREGEQSSGRRSGENYRNNQEQQYGGRNSQETGNIVISDSRLTPPSYAPVRQEYTDITGNKRYVLEHNKGEYFVWGTYSQHPYGLHPSIESAIEAENNSLLRAYARETDHTVTWVKKRLQENPDFLKAWEKKRLLKKIPGGKISRSRNVSETVTLSKGQIAALRANYEGDKVFTKKEVAAAISTIDALQKLSAAMRNELVTHLWRGYNERLNEQGFEQFTEIMWHRIHAEILQENGFEMSEDEIAHMDEQIVNALEQIVQSGKPSVRARLESATSTEGYRKQADFWRGEHSKAVQRNKQLNSLKFELEKLANQKKGLYVNAANYHGDDFKVAIDELAKMNWRGGLVNDTKIREHFAKLAAWYTKDNPLYKGDGGTGSLFRQEIADVLNSLGNSQNGALSVEDLQAAVTVAKYFAHEIEAHNTVFKDGKRVDAMPEAKDYIEKARRAKEIAAKCGIWSNLMRSKFARMVADPAMLMRQADGYLSGFFTEQYEALRQGTIDAAVLERELSEEFEKFWEEHKAYAKRYNDATVKFGDTEMPLQEGLSLFMTMKREHAFAGLAGAGFEIDGKKATENISNGFADEVNRQLAEDWKVLPPEELLTLTKKKNAEMERAALKTVIEKKRQALYDQFTAEDRELIALMERAFEQCRDVKVKIDEIVQGYSNVTGGYYYPIKRMGLAENVDAYTGFEGDRVTNLSMNKETVKNAHKLLIEPAHIVFVRHLKATSLYHGLGVFTDNFNRLYNLNIGFNANNPITVRTALGQSTKFTQEMVKYFKELKQDVEGISKKRSQEKAYNDAVAFIRSSYATYQLGANPKVWVTQLSSLIAATNIIDADCLAKGISVSGKDVDEFCRLAWLRNNDSSAAQAQAVGTSQNAVQRASRNVLQKVRDVAMLPIGKVDRLVITRLFGACQVQIEKKGGAKVGTKENKIEAGKLLQRVILETQQNSLATERSAAMRAGDELLKGFTMFSADAMKVGARFVDAFGELSVLRTLYREVKKAGNSKDMARLEGEIKRARKQCVRATVSLVGVALFNAALAYGFKWLYRRDEDESLGSFIADTFGNMLGGIPFVRDLWSFFQDGFEMDHFLISTVNDVLGTVSASFELVSDAASGKEVTRQQVLANMRKVVYAAGQLSGVPTRNLYNFTTGVINRVSPEAGYAVESRFFKQSYASDLQKALDAGDDKMVGTIAGLMIDEKIGIEDAATRKTLQDLTSKGYKVLPRSVGDSVTVDGEEIALTGAQQKKLREVYAIGQDAVTDMVKLKQFAEADDEVKAKAIKFVYDVYWDLALEDALGVDLAEKNVLFAEAIDIEKLAVIIAMARSIEADKDKDGKAILGTRKRKVQTFVNSLRLSAAEKYMVMGYLGYSNVNGEGAVKTHISKLNLSKGEKAALLKYSGYGA